jgi:membrane protein DedA with SNARE-associated domain
MDAVSERFETVGLDDPISVCTVLTMSIFPPRDLKPNFVELCNRNQVDLMLSFTQDAVASLIEIIKAHEAWAAPAAFLFAFIKSLAFVSLVIPGTTLLLAIGAVVGASGLSLFPIWLAVSLGAALGDWVSYEFGRRLDRAAFSIWPLSKHPDIIPRAEAFFHRWGALSIVGCRFFGPLRATIPLVAGIFHMPKTTFQIANLSSAFLWSSALLLPGTFVFAQP